MKLSDGDELIKIGQAPLCPKCEDAVFMVPVCYKLDVGDNAWVNPSYRCPVCGHELLIENV